MSASTTDTLDTITEIASERIAANAVDVDEGRAFPADNLRALAEAGALGLVVPAESGGRGGALSALAEACEAIGGACASTGMVFLMHSVTAATIAGAGGARAGEVLAAMADGSVLGSLAFSERGTGARFYAPELTAVRNGDGLTVSGRKSFVTSGGHAGAYLILLRADDDAADIYLVSGDHPGVRADGAWMGLGMRGNSSVALELTDVALTVQDRIGEPGQATGVVFGTVAPFFLIGLAAVNVGIASAAARAATEHAAQRRYADGSLLAEVEYVQHLLADMDATVRQARLLVREAAALGEAGDASALVAIMECKVVATEAATAVTQHALEATGGQGYTPALPIERHLRDARAGAVMAPTNAVLRSWIGKALAGLPVP